MNAFAYLADNLIDGPLGLKALFYSQPFPAGYVKNLNNNNYVLFLLNDF